MRNSPHPPVSYGAYIGDKEVYSEHWAHCIDSRSAIRDPIGTSALKQALDRGHLLFANHIEDTIGRCSIATMETVKSAIASAFDSHHRWSWESIDTRFEFANLFRKNVQSHRDRLIDILIAEGHTERMAEGELGGIDAFYSPETTSWCRNQMWFENVTPVRRDIIHRIPDGVLAVSTATALSQVGVPAVGNG